MRLPQNALKHIFTFLAYIKVWKLVFAKLGKEK